MDQVPRGNENYANGNQYADIHSPAPYTQGSVYGNFNGANQAYHQQYAQHVPPQNLQAFQSYHKPAVNALTIAPQALAPPQRGIPQRLIDPALANPSNAVNAQVVTDNQDALIRAIPKGGDNGRFLTIDFTQLLRATNAERIAPYANLGGQQQEFPVNRATVLPAYARRHSRNDLKRLAKNDPKLVAKLSSKQPKPVVAPRIGQVGANGARLDLTQAASGIKYEGDESSSDSSSDDSDVSLYSDEEEATAGTPLPSKRPDDDPKAAVEYDVIKALWRNKKKTIEAQSIRDGLKDFWEVVKTIRDRWKADSEAVKAAECKKQVGDLPLLKSRVKAQREMIEVAFRTAMKHGFKQIVELFSENQSLLFLCHQFLLDRAKIEEWQSSLAHIVLETLAITTSITEEKLIKTHLIKSLTSYAKSGHAKLRFYAQKSLNAAAAATAAASAAPTKPVPVKAEPESTAGIKRSSAAAGNAASAAAAKRPATNGVVATTKTAGTVKKAGASLDAAKKPTIPASATAVKPKAVVAKPSGFFNLQSAAKKPGTSNAEKAVKPAERKPITNTNLKPAFNLAETLANLGKPREEPKKAEPKPEVAREIISPEKKAKRAARLSRGATNVRFRDGSDLVQIRIFEHDPAEEIDHDASQVRDVKDVGGEGRMLKQHQDQMDVDDDDDSDDESKAKFKAFHLPEDINFSPVDPEERNRLYAPYGGGPLKADSPETVQRKQYEASTLMVFYTDASEIPPNPREPADPYNGEQLGSSKQFGGPPEKYITRGRQKTQQRAATAFRHMPPGMAGLNLSAMPGFNAQQSFAPAQQAQAPPPGGATDIQALLKTLAANGLMAPQPPPPQPLAAPPIQMPSFPGFPMPHNFPPPPPNLPKLANGEPDLAAILATLNASSAQPQPPPNFSGFPIYQPPPAGMSGGEGKNDGVKHPFYKTKVCSYWQEGKCKKGAECSYLHDKTKKADQGNESAAKKPKKVVEELRCSHCVGQGLGTKGQSCKHKRRELKLIKEAEMMRRYMKSMRHKLWVQRKGFVCRCDICDPDEDEEN
ncbi:hypothetical protein B0A48_10974 [Cryoendolithus antarcticus]|uniref:C3H1-type domain-containing protein n=1 Tax=Cryoendolithus antarcticus TaxID=1507870 RepID=A0A1V8SYX8_9PEZI|nr:hypothetical protein B0A48_10974 [Cryoendolithus antarcticus]